MSMAFFLVFILTWSFIFWTTVSVILSQLLRTAVMRLGGIVTDRISNLSLEAGCSGCLLSSGIKMSFSISTYSYIVVEMHYYYQHLHPYFLQSMNTQDPTTQTGQPMEPVEQGIIDPYSEIKAGNPFPLIASIKYADLNQLIDENTPLLHLLCKMYLPLDQLLAGKEIEFTRNAEGKTPLHFAIQSGDIHAVYWCLKHSPQINPKDNTGLTPAMIALKRGFRYGFMLCVHYGHVDEELAHVAAFSNDEWALRFLRTLKVDLFKKNPGGITPMGVGAHHFSYQAVYYLARLRPHAIDLQEITKASQSVVLLKNVLEIKKKADYGAEKLQEKLLTPTFFKETFLLATLFLLFSSLPDLKYVENLHLLFGGLFFSICLMYWPVNHGPKRAINIQHLLKPPTFPQGLQICPDCINIKDQGSEHCEQCGVCVPFFHFHRPGGLCVYRGNQRSWFLKQLLSLTLLFSLLQCFLNSYPDTMYTTTYLRVFQTLWLLSKSNNWVHGVSMYLICWFWFIKKLLLLIAILYMMLTGYTYQEMMNNHRYPYLYKPVKHGDGYQNKRIYLFDEGVNKGLKKAFRNALNFFFDK